MHICIESSTKILILCFFESYCIGNFGNFLSSNQKNFMIIWMLIKSFIWIYQNHKKRPFIFSLIALKTIVRFVWKKWLFKKYWVRLCSSKDQGTFGALTIKTALDAFLDVYNSSATRVFVNCCVQTSNPLLQLKEPSSLATVPLWRAWSGTTINLESQRTDIWTIVFLAPAVSDERT